MKRFAVVFVLVSLLVAPSAFAQLGYGIHGGLDFASYTSLDENMAETDSYAPGFNFGATATYDITEFVNKYHEVEKFQVRGNIGFAMFKPASDEFDIMGSKMELDYTLSTVYIEVEGVYFINSKTYALIGLGIAPYSLSVDVTSDNALLSALGSGAVEGETKIGPMVGAGYLINDKLAIEAKAGCVQIRVNAVYFIK